jgi:hypothetical protein
VRCHLAHGPMQSIGAKSFFHSDPSSLDRRYFLALDRNLPALTIGKADKDFTVHSMKADLVQVQYCCGSRRTHIQPQLP